MGSRELKTKCIMSPFHPTAPSSRERTTEETSNSGMYRRKSVAEHAAGESHPSTTLDFVEAARRFCRSATVMAFAPGMSKRQAAPRKPGNRWPYLDLAGWHFAHFASGRFFRANRFLDRKLGKPIGKMPGIPGRMASSSLLRITACLHTLGPTVRYDAGKSLPGKRSHDKTSGAHHGRWFNARCQDSLFQQRRWYRSFLGRHYRTRTQTTIRKG